MLITAAELKLLNIFYYIKDSPDFLVVLMSLESY